MLQINYKHKNLETEDAPLYSNERYIALITFKSFFNLTFRYTVAFSRDLFPERACPSFQALHWFSKNKLSLEELKVILRRLKKLLKPLLPHEDTIFILDTTGISFRGKVQKLKWLRGELLKKAKGHSRLCSLVRYFRKAKLLVIEGVEVGLGYASDEKLGLNVLEEAEGGGLLLADGGFDSITIMRMAKERRLKPVIKLKGGGEIKDKIREEIKRVLDTGLYRLRGVGEGVFGGIKTKMNGPLRCLNIDVAKREALLEALVYNIRIYLSLFLLLFHLVLASLFNGIIRQTQL